MNNTKQKHTFLIDYLERVLTLNYRGKTFTWDINEGDLSDFWHSFRYNRKQLDINLYHPDKDKPTLTIYELKRVGGKYVIDTNRYEIANLWVSYGNADKFLH
jgi:hypothetical protein